MAAHRLDQPRRGNYRGVSTISGSRVAKRRTGEYAQIAVYAELVFEQEKTPDRRAPAFAGRLDESMPRAKKWPSNQGLEELQ
jgi:hypothetical protein